MGRWYDIEQILAQGIDLELLPVLAFLIKNDFPGLLDFAKQRGYKTRDQGYLSKCHLCVDIRTHLFQSGEFKELNPRGFYEAIKG